HRGADHLGPRARLPHPGPCLARRARQGPRRRGHGRVRALRREHAAQRGAARGRLVLLPRQSPPHRPLTSLAGPIAPPSPTPLIVEADDTTWRTLWVLCVYRVVLALLMAVAFVYLNRFFNFGVVSPQAVMPTVGSYIAAAVALLVPARLREPSLMLQVTAGVI